MISILCLSFLDVDIIFRISVVPKVSGILTDSNVAKKDNSMSQHLQQKILRLLLSYGNCQIHPLTAVHVLACPLIMYSNSESEDKATNKMSVGITGAANISAYVSVLYKMSLGC